jgi:hypothetical protein
MPAATLRQRNDAAHTKDRVDRILRLLVDTLVPGLAFGFFWRKLILAAVTGASWANSHGGPWFPPACSCSPDGSIEYSTCWAGSGWPWRFSWPRMRS